MKEEVAQQHKDAIRKSWVNFKVLSCCMIGLLGYIKSVSGA
jgi:hypothetical protein